MYQDMYQSQLDLLVLRFWLLGSELERRRERGHTCREGANARESGGRDSSARGTEKTCVSRCQARPPLPERRRVLVSQGGMGGMDATTPPHPHRRHTAQTTPRLQVMRHCNAAPLCAANVLYVGETLECTNRAPCTGQTQRNAAQRRNDALSIVCTNNHQLNAWVCHERFTCVLEA